MALPQAKNGDYNSLSDYNKRAIAKNPALASRYGVTNYKPGMTASQSAVAPTNVAQSPDYTKQINNLYDPLLTAADQSLAANKTALNTEFGDLATKLRETAGKSEQGLTESMNRYGLLESGRTAAGIGDIQKNLSSDIGKADIQRAIQEANLVLENAQYKSNVGLQKMGALEKLNPSGFDQQQFQESIRRYNLESDLNKYGLDMKKVTDAAGVYNTFLNAGEDVPEWLYNKLKDLVGG
jgi:hypothetical protein